MRGCFLDLVTLLGQAVCHIRVIERNSACLWFCSEVKNPPELEGDDLEDSAVQTAGFQVPVLTGAPSVLTEKMIQRELLLGKWRTACRFPGLEAPGRVVIPSVALGSTYPL